MLKQILIYAAIATSLGLVGYFVYDLLQSESQNIDAIALVPDGVETVITLERIAMWPGQSTWTEALIKNPNSTGTAAIWQQWQDWNTMLYSQTEKDAIWQTSLSNSNIAYAGTNTSSADHWLFVFIIDGQHIGAQEWITVLTEKTSETRNFKGQTIYHASDIYCTQIGSGILTSRSVATIEGCILANQNQGSMVHHAPFMQAYEVRSSDNPLHFFAAYNDQEWLQLDPILGNSGPNFIGLQMPQDSTFQTTVVHGRGPQHFEVPSWLPSSTYYWDAIHFDSSEELTQACESFYASTTHAAFWQTAWQSFGDSCACDLNESLLSWRNGQCGVVAWDVNDSVGGEVYYFGIRDSLDIAKVMPGSLLKKLNTAGAIYQIQIPILFDRNRISSLHVEPSYMMQLNKFLLLSASLEDLLALNAANTEHLPPSFLAKTHAVTKNLSRLTYLSAKSDLTTLPPSMHSLVLSGREQLITYNTAAAQSTLVSIYMVDRLSLSAEPEATVINTNSTPSSTTARSWPVINHITSQKETMEELADGNLQLKDEGGKVLWTFSKSESILGDIQQIDALKNGKLQYAFTTSKGLFVVDRNGQAYAPLCIPSTSAVTSPLAVFDYEMNKNYRLVFATEDGDVKNYGTTGQKTEGWQYEKQGIVKRLLHFKQGTDDCLLTIDMDGQLHLHKRNGLVRPEKCSQLKSKEIDVSRVVVGNNLNLTRLHYQLSDGTAHEEKIIAE